MEVIETVSVVLIVTGFITINLVTRLLYRWEWELFNLAGDVVPVMLCCARYHSSILYIKRNILTYLSLLLVTSINLISNSTVGRPQPEPRYWLVFSLQNLGVLSRLVIGLQPPVLARLLNGFLSVCFYLFLATNVTITVFRIVLVTKVSNTSLSTTTPPTPPLHPAAWQVLECWPREAVQEDPHTAALPILGSRHICGSDHLLLLSG